MKIAKILGPLAIAMLATMASLGAGSASAAETTLCKTNTISPYCEASDSYAANTTIEASSTNVILAEGEAYPPTFKCSESSLKGQTGAKTGEPLPVSFNLALGGCTGYDGDGEELGKCTATSKGGSYSADLSWTSSSTGTLTAEAGLGLTWTFDCGSYTCIYGHGNHGPKLTFEGGHKAKIAIPMTDGTAPGTTIHFSEGTGLWYSYCPHTLEFGATYTVNSPDPVYPAVASGSLTGLCRAAQSPCEPLNIYPGGTTIKAEASEITIEGSVFSMTCGKTTMTAKALATGVEPPEQPLGEVKFTPTNCTGGCMVTAQASGPSGGTSLSGGGIWLGKFNGEPTWTVKCSSIGYECILRFEGVVAEFFGGNPATFNIDYAVLPHETPKGGLCQETNELFADFTVTSPKPLFASLG